MNYLKNTERITSKIPIFLHNPNICITFAPRQNATYVRTVCSEDISRIDGKRRDEKIAAMILRSYARNISSLAKKATMLADVVASEEIECSIDTFNNYVNALERLFVIQDIDAWCPGRTQGQVSVPLYFP